MTRSARLLCIYTIFLIAVIYLPVVLIPAFSFNDSTFVAFPLKGFTLTWYHGLLDNQPMLTALSNSLILGVSVSVVSTAIGLVSAYSLIDTGLRRRGLLLGIATLPILVPGIIIGISLLVLMSRILGVSLSLWTIGIGHLVLCSPFSLLVILSRLEGLDRNLADAARDLGESEFGIIRRLILPLCWPAVLASLLLCFTLSFDEFVISFFLSGIDVTLPVYIYSQLRFPSAFPSVLALGALVLLASGLMVAIAEMLRRKNVATTGSR